MTSIEDLRDQLFARRIVVASGWLDDAGVTDVAAQLLSLDALGDDDITLRLESFGCTIAAALALTDALGVVGVEVTGVGSGRLTGGAVAALAVCDRRAVMPHVLVELREPEHRFSVVGRRPEDLAAAASVAAEQRRQLCARMAGGDDRLAAAFEAAFARGQLLDADDVVRAGLADEVMRPPLGFR